MTLVLQAGQILAVNNVTSVNVYWGMWGCEVIAGVPQYKALAQGGPLAAANAWKNIYQVPTGCMTLVSHLMLMQYPGAGQQQVYVGTGSGGYLANSILLPASGWASWEWDGWHLFDNLGHRLGFS